MENRRPEMNTEIMKKCPINNTLGIIEKKFTVLILRNMLYSNHKRFNQLLDNIEDINHKTLAIRLKEMVKSGLIEKKVYNGDPVRIEYELTEKGKGLMPILEQMAAYSITYCPKDVFVDGKPRSYKEVFGVDTQPF